MGITVPSSSIFVWITHSDECGTRWMPSGHLLSPWTRWGAAARSGRSLASEPLPPSTVLQPWVPRHASLTLKSPHRLKSGGFSSLSVSFPQPPASASSAQTQHNTSWNRAICPFCQPQRRQLVAVFLVRGDKVTDCYHLYSGAWDDSVQVPEFPPSEWGPLTCLWVTLKGNCQPLACLAEQRGRCCWMRCEEHSKAMWEPCWRTLVLTDGPCWARRGCTRQWVHTHPHTHV